jgi:hypothetical protein
MAAGLAPSRGKSGQRRPGKPGELVERLPHRAPVAAEGCHDVGLDRRIIRAGDVEFDAGRDQDASDDAQIVALRRGQRAVSGHSRTQSNRLARRCFIWSAM